MLSIIECAQAENKRFFKIVLSDILREISWCKHSGFKMHRDPKKMTSTITEEVFLSKFHAAATSNIMASQRFAEVAKSSKISIIEGDSTKLQEIEPCSIDLILTSPPYGDSQTTVAYGQFSRLSLQWLGLKPQVGSETNLDNYLLGGTTAELNRYDELLAKSMLLTNVYEIFMSRKNACTEKSEEKKLTDRLRDILAFYSDLDKSIQNASVYLKKNKYFILVTGSRVVKGVKLNTDLIIAELAAHYGFELKSIFYRNIESKRMPSKVSSTNVKGEVSPTMTKESIIVLKKLMTSGLS